MSTKQKQTRRQFMQTSAGLTAAASVTGAFTSRLSDD